MTDTPSPATDLGAAGTAGTPSRVSLRDALGAPRDPDFTLVLPPGWTRRPVTADERTRMDAAMRARLMEVHRPDLYARMRVLLAEAFAQLDAVGAVAMFLPDTDESPGALVLPASLTARVLRAEPGATLDDHVRASIVRDGATPLLGDKRILRAERESEQHIDGESALLTTVVYLSPIPGSGRRRALQLTLVITRPVDVPADDPPLLQMRALFDLCVSSLAWVSADDDADARA
ncbi:hypothetical protein N3K63_01120 [Microbacterium sp. W1N]|uniref:hypothetical protein n=1 Tax=Microbacterium festucae TaxID=2977531 RepID=UPI0021C06ED2|nr:hypothetical protein [Microbacterium festucae]MCT9818879.1 hypothetical protein [Microbacterium festucae]